MPCKNLFGMPPIRAWFTVLCVAKRTFLVMVRNVDAAGRERRGSGENIGCGSNMEKVKVFPNQNKLPFYATLSYTQ